MLMQVLRSDLKEIFGKLSPDLLTKYYLTFKYLETISIQDTQTFILPAVTFSIPGQDWLLNLAWIQNDLPVGDEPPFKALLYWERPAAVIADSTESTHFIGADTMFDSTHPLPSAISGQQFSGLTVEFIKDVLIPKLEAGPTVSWNS